MSRRDIRRFSVLVIVFAVGLWLLTTFGPLDVRDALNLLMLFALVSVTTIYARETTRIAHSTEMATFGGLHPVLSIVGPPQLLHAGLTQWRATPSNQSLSGINVVNFGPGPALNGILALYNGTTFIHQVTLPTLGPQWGHVAVVELREELASATILRLNYQDVFEHQHATSYEFTFIHPGNFTLGPESHECIYP